MLQDIRYAIQVLRKNASFSIVATATLALGIGANTLLFSVVHGVVLSPLPYPAAQELVEIQSFEAGPNGGAGPSPTRTSPIGRGRRRASIPWPPTPRGR